MTIDPILLEVLRNRLDTIADEMELTLLKSAASPIVKEGLDASAALFNVHGETVAQAAAIPIHLGALQFAAQRIVRAFPPEKMQEGDAFLLNDPYDGGTHLPDITLAVPVFVDGRAVALACTMCHHQDVGGRTPGSAARSPRPSCTRGSASRISRARPSGSSRSVSSRRRRSRS
jgi:N-methylhydantoinase B